jgi:hypothetical protein
VKLLKLITKYLDTSIVSCKNIRHTSFLHAINLLYNLTKIEKINNLFINNLFFFFSKFHKCLSLFLRFFDRILELDFRQCGIFFGTGFPTVWYCFWNWISDSVVFFVFHLILSALMQVYYNNFIYTCKGKKITCRLIFKITIRFFYRFVLYFTSELYLIAPLPKVACSF